MGFSLGAALAATFLLREENLLRQGAGTGDKESQVARRIRCAIFLSGTLPCDWSDCVSTGKVRPLEAVDVGEKISIPTVHAWSLNDTDYPGQSAQLVQICEASNRVEALHGAGHGVPSQGEDLMGIVDAIQRTMTRFRQSETSAAISDQ